MYKKSKKLYIVKQIIYKLKYINMEIYQNKGKRSSIEWYDIEDGLITVHFFTWYWKHYTYTNFSTWEATINEMQKLARLWEWLNTYISKNKPKYASKC